MKKQRVWGILVISVLVVISIIINGRGVQADVQAAPRVESVRAPTATLIVTSTADSGAGTLRQALTDAVGGDIITFDPAVFPPTSPVTIALTSALPDITQGNLAIDASNVGVIIDGSGVSQGDGLRITSDGNTVKGLQIIHFPDDGVEITNGAKYNTIGGDWTAGSALRGEGNVITMNRNDGVNINGIGTMTNTVSGNLIGLDLDGTRDIRVRAMAISPNYTSDQTLFIGTKNHGVWRTTDGGSNWAMVSNGLTISDVLSLAISPSYNADGTVFAGTPEGGIFRSTNHGISWTRVDGGVTAADIRVLAISPGYTTDGTILAGTWDGVFVSCDGGSNWEARSNGLASRDIRALAISPNFVTDETIFVGTSDARVYKSTDQGSNWVDVRGDWTQRSVTALAISPNYASDQTIFAATSWGDPCSEVFRTVNAGNSWNSVGGDPGWCVIFGLAVSPNYAVDQTLFVGDEWSGTYRSTDEGTNWIQTLTGYRHWAMAISHAYASDQTLFVGTSADGVLKSVDGGGAWVEISSLTERGNDENGVSVRDGAQWNVIGGNTAGERNIIANNGRDGVSISGNATISNAISGNYIGTDANGMAIQGNGMGGVVIRDGAHRNVIGGTTAGERNIISGNGHRGVEIGDTGTVGNTVIGNYIGTDATGLVGLGDNGYSGVWICSGAQYNRIGGTTPEERNIISGNDGNGIQIDGDHNAASGNFIGTDVTGTTAIPNNGAGVSIGNGASQNVIGGNNATPGGPCTGACNLISGNDGDGVCIEGGDTMSNTVSGNLIGTAVTGTLSLSNSRDGVRIERGARYNVVGGDSPEERNVVSGNSLSGVSMGGGASENVVIGNYIGTDASGMTSVGNGRAGDQAGVAIYGGATQNRIERNVISGNNTIGVSIDWGLDSDDNVVIGNHIGTDATGTGALGNTFAGIFVADNASDNIIGGSTAAEENIIAYNGVYGVYIRDTATIRNTITHNSIHSNADKGIELSDGGNTELDPPIITQPDLNAGTVTGIACPGCTVEIFSDSNDEGEVYEGQTRADVAGAFAFDKGNLLTGPHVNATATDAAGNTSEFSVGVRQVTPLALGSPLEDSVEPLAYSDYMLEIGAGERLLIEVTSLNGVGQIWLYGQVGHMPSQARYDLRATQPTVQETHELLVAPTRVGTYYFSVFGWDITAEQATYTIVARAVDLYLSDVQPRSAGNTGEATLNVQGLGFVDGLDVELRRSGSPTLVADDVMQLSSTAMSAHFDLTGVDLGVYDVVAIWPGGAEEELEEAFEVLTGGVGSRLEASLEAPDFVRPDRTFTLWLDYANTGDAEMVAPLFVISSTQGVPMRLAEQEPFEDRAFQILGGNIDGLAGTLPPGTSGRIPIYLHVPADTGAHEMLDFDLAIMISDTMLIDWDEVEDEVRPPDVDPEVWDVLWPSLTAQIGDTWGDYRQALADSASYLSSLGRTVYGVRELFRFEVRKVLGMNPRTVLADRLDAYAPAPGMPLQFGRVFPGSLEGRLYLGPLGRGWSHSYDITLEEQSDGDVLIHWPGSFTRLFASNSDGTYTALPGDYGTLARDGDIFELTEKDGTVYWFRADGQLDYSEDLNDNRVTVVYDAGDRLIEIRHSNGDSFVLEYDAHGCISRLTDHVGRVTEYSYDATGEHLLTVTAPGNRVTTYTYNSPGGQPTDHALLSITYPDGTHQYYAYEGLGRLSEEQLDGSAEWISYTYDTFSRIHVTDVSGETTIISPDEHGRPARMRDALGRDLGQEYSPEFNLSRLTDPTGQPYKFDYDHLGNVIGTENPLGQQVKLGYDTRFSKIASLEDTRGNRSTFEYDDAGNLTALTYPDGVSEAIAYDSAGNPTTYTSRSGDVITYTHNTRGQLLRKDYPDGSWAAYTYDVAGNMTSASDVSGTVTMEYDEDTNLLTRITYPSGHYFEYSYNDAGQRVQRLDQDGHELNYEYDTAGRLLRLYDEHGADFITYEYDAVGRLSKESKGNGTYTTYAYDAAGQILSMVNYALDDTVQSRFEYTYDANGNRTSMTTLDGTTTYKYDLIGQLTGVTYPDGRHVSYEYDEAGNRITITDDGAPTDYTTNEMNQYAQMGDVTYTYDADGNMISKTDATSTTTYEYDYENRLVRVTTPLSGTWKYTYGALGNRVAVEHNGVLTRYVHDPTGLVDVAAEYGGDGSPVAWYIHGLGLVARIDAAGDSAYYAFDATGHARQLTDDTGAVVNTYDYSPFGIPLQVDETIPNPCRYVGRFGVIEEGNGLTFMRARHYDPSIGRFTAVDPIGIAGGVNLYSYVRNNPVSGQDPMGLARRGWMYWVPEIAKDILGSMQEALEEAGLYGLPFNLEGVGELAELAGRNWGDFGSVSWDELSVAAQHTLGEVGDLVKFLSYDVPYWWFTRNIDQTSIPADLGNSDLPSNTTEQISIDSTENIRPDDPNEKVGPVGSGEQHLVSADDELHYVIYFENKPEAGAPAQEVFVADYLDPDLDWSTFRLTEIAWGDHIIAAPENTGEFSTRQTVKDYREEVEKSWWVDVQVALNYASGRARWTFRTVDPETEDLPLDPLAGFLPPNDETGRGDGHVAFTIRPRADSPDGAVLTNKATIIFDTNDPIATNEVTNVIGQSKLYLPLILRNYTPVAFPLHIGDAIPERPVAYQGETFYVKSVQIPDELPPGGHYYFSPKGTPSPRRWWMTHWLPCWTESIYPLHAANARHTHPATGLLRPAGRQCPASIHQWAEQVPADWNSKNRTARCSLPSSRN